MKKGFTLVELLVVISIIALLLSIMMPSLSAAREVAKSIVCQTHVKSFAMSNMMYAIDDDRGMCVPPQWITNSHFQTLLGMDSGIIEENIKIVENDASEWLKCTLPKGLLCASSPAAKRNYVTVVGVGNNNGGSATSYGYNAGNYKDNIKPTYSWSEKEEFHKLSDIRSASEKIMFIDCSDIILNSRSNPFTSWMSGINYELHWDAMGDYIGRDQSGTYHWGNVAYRHKDKANIALYDGHVESRHKKKLWVTTGQYSSTDNATMRGMWRLPK